MAARPSPPRYIVFVCARVCLCMCVRTSLEGQRRGLFGVLCVDSGNAYIDSGSEVISSIMGYPLHMLTNGGWNYSGARVV